MITSFEPIIDKNCKILTLGTMPSVRSLESRILIAVKEHKSSCLTENV